jgi:hypothetical protein
MDVRSLYLVVFVLFTFFLFKKLTPHIINYRFKTNSMQTGVFSLLADQAIPYALTIQGSKVTRFFSNFVAGPVPIAVFDVPRELAKLCQNV